MRLESGGTVVPAQMPTVIAVFFREEELNFLSCLFDVCNLYGKDEVFFGNIVYCYIPL